MPLFIRLCGRANLAVCLFVSLLGADRASGGVAARHLPSTTQALLEDEPHPRTTLLTWGDGAWESGLIWLEGGVAPPDYGAFAECYSGEWSLLSIVLDLTVVPPAGPTRTCDAYLWSDDGGEPGLVLDVVTGFDPGEIPVYPNYKRVYASFAEPHAVSGDWWVGFWPRWVDQQNAWYLACDHNGTMLGCMRTNIAPAMGEWFPIGWQSIEIVWGPHTSIGISALVDALPMPIDATTWGRVKRLYR